MSPMKRASPPLVCEQVAEFVSVAKDPRRRRRSYLSVKRSLQALQGIIGQRLELRQYAEIIAGATQLGDSPFGKGDQVRARLWNVSCPERDELLFLFRSQASDCLGERLGADCRLLSFERGCFDSRR